MRDQLISLFSFLGIASASLLDTVNETINRSVDEFGKNDPLHIPQVDFEMLGHKVHLEEVDLEDFSHMYASEISLPSLFSDSNFGVKMEIPSFNGTANKWKISGPDMNGLGIIGLNIGGSTITITGNPSNPSSLIQAIPFVEDVKMAISGTLNGQRIDESTRNVLQENFTKFVNNNKESHKIVGQSLQSRVQKVVDSVIQKVNPFKNIWSIG